ncbi:MAG: prepilin peptidase [Chloroflexi bacterium]|nr:prepilin peptidase [Chloroflexota bacterium]
MDIAPPVPTAVAWPALALLLGVAAVADLRSRHVPILLLGGGLLTGLVLAALVGGSSALGHSLLGVAVGGGLLLPFVLVRGKPPGLPRVERGEALGPADALLLAAVGAWQGPLFALQAAVAASLVGAVWALVAWCRAGRRRGVVFPYVPSLALGAVLATLLR